MTYTIDLKLYCTHVSEVKTVTSKKTGKQYKLVECDFVNDDDNIEILRLPVFINEHDAQNAVMEDGERYKVRLKKYYDRSSKTEKESVEVVSRLY